jgi:hypothetical protein
MTAGDHSRSRASGGALRLLEAVGLHRRELRSWALYDWGNSVFATTVMSAMLPIFYSEVAASGLPDNVATAYWGYTTGAKRASRGAARQPRVFSRALL